MMQRIIILALAMVAVAAQGFAQSNSSNSGVSRRDGNSGRNSQAQASGVSERMHSHFGGEGSITDADVQWMRVIYRQLDLLKAKNAPLYFPEDLIDGQENLFRIIMRLLCDNQISAYEYLDGREIFTDDYKVKMQDVMDRFHIINTPAKGSTEKNPKFVVNESDVPTNEVLSYYMVERWEFDTRTNRMRTNVEAICPVLHRAGDFGGDAIKYPMFWVKFNDLRPYLAQQPIFVSDDNNLPTCTYDDFFTLNLYDGEIYKTRNLRNQSLMQMHPEPDDLKRAQDSIQARLDTFEDKLWVPDREEIIAAKEARDKAKADKKEGSIADAVAAPDVTPDADASEATPAEDKTEKRSVRSTSRSSKSNAKKPSKPKSQAKPKSSSSSSSNSVRSVRKKK